MSSDLCGSARDLAGAHRCPARLGGWRRRGRLGRCERLRRTFGEAQGPYRGDDRLRQSRLWEIGRRSIVLGLEIWKEDGRRCCRWRTLRCWRSPATMMIRPVSRRLECLSVNSQVLPVRSARERDRFPYLKVFFLRHLCVFRDRRSES